MNPDVPSLEMLRSLNELAAFNRWCGIEVAQADVGSVVIEMPWREEVGQYVGFMHAGVVGALIDTACGYAAATVAGSKLLASHFSVNCLRPAVGDRFIAKARVVKPGKSQIFTSCELYGRAAGKEVLVATGETLLSVVSK
ncbi:PaaI family thioesterase [Pelomonas sp. KK5]|uniref:PaaI family thioesterase n=1 Tax=Pelomonas sp. KK5 TaxID=1855730 RepID=UPI00097C0A1B|nr:PaaI family thioesterase [Pelomonas sp. KK5]